MSKKFAVIILNYNAKEYLGDCLRSLEKQTSKDFDILVADNNSTDGSVSYLKKFFRRINILQTGSNLGYTGGYNYIFSFLNKQKRKYDYYLLLNPDTSADKDLIKTLINIFLQNKNAGIVVPTVIDKNSMIDSLGGKYLLFPGTTMGFYHGQHYKRGNAIFRSFWASGSALAIRVPILNKVGFFNSYFMYYDDVDLSWRVHSAGYNVLATDATYIKHVQGGSKAPSDRNLYLNERNRILCHWQNLPTVFFFLSLPLFIFLRLMLVGRFSHSVSNILSKLRGLLDGLLLFWSYPKSKYIAKDIKTLMHDMYEVEKIDMITL